MSVVVYHYPNCSSSKKAIAFLEDAGIDVTLKNIAETPPSNVLLGKAYKLLGLPLKKLFNTSGKSYREGGFKEKLLAMTEDQALSALAEDGMLIKRPLVLGDGFALVGFKEDEWLEAFGHSQVIE